MMTVGEAQVPVRIIIMHLWLEILLFLSGWAQFGQPQYHSPPEVVTPLRVTGTHRGESMPGWLSYSLHFGGQSHIVHMKVKKNFLSTHFSVFTYTEQGALFEEQPFVQTDCYYHGFVEDDPESLVVLSTCSGGFHGILEIYDTVYEIQPKMFSATFEHLVYKVDSEESQFPPMRCGLTEEEIARQLKLQKNDNPILEQSGFLDRWTHKGTIELGVVVDYERYLHLDSNISNVEDEAILVINAANEYYEHLQIDLVFYGLEIWTEKNLIAIGGMGAVLSAFCEWKRGGFNDRIHNDAAVFLVKKGFGRLAGLAFVGTICNGWYNGAIISCLGDIVAVFGYLVAHELGHMLGMNHDTALCTCGDRWCIMTPTRKPSSRFSNCSYEEFINIGSRKGCIRDVPKPESIFSKIQCGNSVTEKGEQCDCGSTKQCEEDPCCFANCTLKPGAVCGTGLCCKDCQISPSGTVCRRKENVCDLPEWCDGNSNTCPADVYVQDGTPCMTTGYCYEKRCNVNRDEQCRKIFGKEARSANEICYTRMNTRGDRFGNCGLGAENYVKCNMADILCGRVQCQNVTQVPALESHSTVYWTQINGVNCWSTDYHFGMTIPDIGEVKDGTECGEEQVCIHRKCVSMSLWKTLCSSKTCNMKGVCNNKHHCHCYSEWRPPKCKNRGHGGSFDSGPPPYPPPTTPSPPTTSTPSSTPSPSPSPAPSSSPTPKPPASSSPSPTPKLTPTPSPSPNTTHSTIPISIPTPTPISVPDSTPILPPQKTERKDSSKKSLLLLLWIPILLLFGSLFYVHYWKHKPA